jgi:hypothetical protein
VTTTFCHLKTNTTWIDRTAIIGIAAAGLRSTCATTPRIDNRLHPALELRPVDEFLQNRISAVAAITKIYPEQKPRCICTAPQDGIIQILYKSLTIPPPRHIFSTVREVNRNLSTQVL